MQFTYDHGIATVEQAMRQAVGRFVRAGDPTVATALDAAVEEVATAALSEIRAIFTAELSTLFDTEALAVDWNEAVEKCIQLIEGSL